MLNPSLHDRLNGLAARFQQHDPFRHVVIDDFFSAEYCSALLAQLVAAGRLSNGSSNGEPRNR